MDPLRALPATGPLPPRVAPAAPAPGPGPAGGPLPAPLPLPVASDGAEVQAQDSLLPQASVVDGFEWADEEESPETEPAAGDPMVAVTGAKESAALVDDLNTPQVPDEALPAGLSAADAAADVASDFGKSLDLAGSSMALVGGVKSLSDAQGSLQKGDYQLAAYQGLGGVASVGEGVGAMAAVAGPGFAPALAGVARAAPALGVVSGVAQVGAALSEDPPDFQKAALGGLMTAGSVVMMMPPPAQLVGVTMVVGAAIVEHWDTIASTAEGAAALASEAMEATLGWVSSWWGE